MLIFKLFLQDFKTQHYVKYGNYDFLNTKASRQDDPPQDNFDVPVTYQYPFVAQITNAIRSITRGVLTYIIIFTPVLWELYYSNIIINIHVSFLVRYVI